MKLSYSAGALILLMVLTRVHHFGDTISLPDASLAVFFLMGFIHLERAYLAILLVLAGLLDYIAIHYFNVSDWCVSLAYLFLIPTYSAVWFAGRYARQFNALSLEQFVLTTACAGLGITSAFIISNVSFYLFSGRYADLAFVNYTHAIAQYYLPYLLSALVYSALGLAVYKGINLMKTLPANNGNKTA